MTTSLNLALILFIFGTANIASTEEAPLVVVYAIRGQTVRLPCNWTTSPEDPVILVLWYKNGTKTPVFSVDLRSMDEGSSTRASDLFEGRARFQKDHLNWVLVVKDVTYSDQGEYRCRLDFQGSPTHNAKVHLHVVDEPHSIRIYSTGGSAVEREASVQEGRPLSLSCRATGGEPLPNVTWWSGPTLLDSEEEERQVKTSPPSTGTPNTQAAPYVTNTLRIDSLTKVHLAQNLTCVAANTPVLRPLTATVLLRQTDTELLVSMDAPTGRLLGDHEYDVKCRASGVRPPPIVTWWLRGNRLMENIDGQSVGPDTTISLLRLLTTPGDDGGILECRASSPTLPHLTASDSTKLTVYYLPKATISIDAGGGQGSTPDFGQPATSASGLREGRSATLTCVTRANPPIYNLTFMFNGRPLHRQNVITKGWSLTLLELRHQDSGLYTCLASNTEGDGESNAVALHIDYAPVCAWKGEREILAAVGEKVKMNCYVKASPPHVTFDWTTSHKESPIHHQDKGLSSEGWMTASNSSRIGINQWAKCYATNDVGSSSHPCIFSITLVEPPSQLVGCDYHEVTTDSAAVTCSAGSTSEKLTPTYHIEVREGDTVILTKNSSKPRFNLSTLSPGRDYVLAMYASHQKGRGKETTLLLRTPTPKAEEVAPERVSINLNNEPGAEILLQQPPSGDSAENLSSSSSSDGLPVNAIVGGAAAVAIGLAGVVAAVVFCRARRAQGGGGSSMSPGGGKTSQQFGHGHHASHDSLLELPHGAMYQPCTRHPSRELLTTFSPGPVVVTQVTSGRSSMRSSPLPRRSSTRSAPGGTSPRRHRPRTPSVRGGPVHVVEVESDSITTPRVEIESPSKSLASIRMSLRGDTSEVRQSPTLSLPCNPLQTPEANAPNEMSTQSLLQTDFQLHPPSSPHLSPQTYVSSPIQAVVLPQPLIIDPAHSAQLHAESPINTVSYATPHISTVPQTLAPSNMFTTAHPYSTAPQICTAPQVHIVAPGSPAPPDIITSQAPITTTMMMMTQLQNTPQIHIESEDQLLSHMQEAAPKALIRVQQPLMNPEVAQQQQLQVAQEASAATHFDGEVSTTALQHYPTTTITPVTKQRSSPDTGLIKFYPTFR